MRVIRSILLFACTVSFANLSLAATPTQSLDDNVRSAAGAVIQQYNIPGLSIAVTQNGQRRFYNVGVASRQTGQSVSSDTLFELGSISKTFTATLATYAQANGQLSLSDHPGKYLPSLQGSAFDKVTLIHLGTHTAGGFPLQVPDEVQNTEQLLTYLKNWQPQYAPGGARTYANPSIGMLGMITANSLHRPYEQALQQLFNTLGLHNSYLDVPANKMSLYAQGYDKQDAPVRLQSGVLGNEAYGVKSSTTDLIHFVESNMALNLPEKPLQKALSDTHVGYFKSAAMTQALIWEQYAWPVTLDDLLRGNSSEMVLKTQPVEALEPPLPAPRNVWINKTGSTNGFGGYVAFIPAKQLGIVILANKNYPNEARVKLAYGILHSLE